MRFSNKRNYWLAILACLFSTLNAQQAGGLSLRNVPMVSFLAQDNAALLENEIAQRVPGRAPRFAITHETDISPATHGVWEELPNNMLSWRIRVNSPNALSLNLGFLEYYMPQGGKLYLYTAKEKSPRIHGPFTPADNEDHQQLWTQVIETDDLVIEVILPAAQRENLRLRLNKVNHDFLGFSASASGSCNLDVVCSAADGWGIVDGYRDIIRSVAVYSRGGATLCTGFLVNNTANDCTPFFMTADHCGMNASNAPSLVTYWNFANSVCRQPNTPASGGPGDGQLNDFNTGSTLLASHSPTDMTLLLLDDDVSPTADAFFAGWSRELPIPEDTIIAIHHPATDEKRISFSFQQPYRVNGVSTTPNANGTHLTIPDWDIGTTEPGSSGSPIYDRFKRVRGQLHGGAAACGNNAFDSYGYFGMSWEGGGTPASRLRDHLDPMGTNPLFIDGREQAACQISVSAAQPTIESCVDADGAYDLLVGGAFTGPVTLQIENLPVGWTAIFSENPAAPGSSISLTLSPPNGTSGNFEFTLQGSDGTFNSESSLFWDISTDTPNAPAAVNPTDGQNNASPFTALEWADNGSSNYEFEAASDPGFTDVIATGVTQGTFGFFDNELDPNTTYYWRIRAENICGFGDWSPTFSFTTVSLLCANNVSEDVPLELDGDAGETIFSFLEIEDDLNAQFISVDVEMEHTFVGDISISLIAPDGSEVLLMDRPGEPASNFGCGGDNLILTFSDNAMNTAEDLENLCENLPALSGAFQPIEPLSTLYGEWEPTDWFISVTDNADQDAGALISWSINFCSPVDIPDYTVSWDNSQQPNGLNLCPLDGASVSFLLGDDFTDNFDIEVTAGGTLLENYTSDFDSDEQVLTVNFTDFVGLAAGNYDLLVVVSENGNTGSDMLPLVIDPAPGLPDLLQPEDNATITDIVPTFEWSAVPNATSYTLQFSGNESFTNIFFEEVLTGTTYAWEPEEIGTFFWRVTAINECGAATTGAFSASVLTSVYELSNGRSVSIYPNPAREDVFVELAGNWNGDLSARLLTLDGKIVKEYILAGQVGRQPVDLSSIPGGTYLLELQQGTDRVVERIVRLP
ncbi:MAG: proprotein convertase P-domain-containing protein [Bacteroidota bacterium]